MDSRKATECIGREVLKATKVRILAQTFHRATFSCVCQQYIMNNI